MKTLTHAAVAAAIDNPLNGVAPDFTVFGAEFTQWWQKLIGAAWAVFILIAVVYLLKGITQMGAATQQGNAQEHAIGRTKALWAGIALAGLAGAAVIVGAILTLAA